MATNQAKEVIQKEIVNLRRVVKGSKLGKHITDNILIPILQKLDPIIDEILDWMGFLLQDEIQYLLSTASQGGDTYEIYYVDTSMPYGQKSVKVGEYTASEKGGPPRSPRGGGSDMPQSGTLHQSIVYKITGSTITVGIEDIESPYRLWFKWGKLFLFEDNEIKPRSTGQYGQILDDPSYGKGVHYRPYFTSAIANIKPQLKKRFREEFQKGLNEVTKRPTVKRAIEIHFIWKTVVTND